jgi:uncharacterized protein YndB with AHSA1/START domain
MTDIHELAIERLIDAPVAEVWRAWTEHLAEWWCPRPWTTELRALELRPGGRFESVMRGPAGEEHGGTSVILEVVPERRIVFTTALDPEWRPQEGSGMMMVGLFDMAPEGERTRYRAAARHWDAATAERHDAMGFEAGWGAVAAQLEEVARRLA